MSKLVGVFVVATVFPQPVFQLHLQVCFAMFMPNLLRNFLYESPRSGNALGDFMMMAAARDIHVAAALSR